MASTRWKGVEREVAAYLDGRRVPSSGNGMIPGDVIMMKLMPSILAECKHGKQVLKAGPKQLSDWLQEAERDAKRLGVLGGMLVLHPDGAAVGDSIVVMRLGLLSGAQRALLEQSKLPVEDA